MGEKLFYHSYDMGIKDGKNMFFFVFKAYPK